MSRLNFATRDRLAWLRVCRPEARNAVADDIDAELARAWQQFESDPKIRHGLHAGDGGLVRLVAIAGAGVALDLALTGRSVGADEALRLRLVNRVVPREQLLAQAARTAAAIARHRAHAVASAKETIPDLIGRPLDDAHRLEAVGGYTSFGDADGVAQATGPSAGDVIIHLVENRPEDWSFGEGLASLVTPTLL